MRSVLEFDEQKKIIQKHEQKMKKQEQTNKQQAKLIQQMQQQIQALLQVTGIKAAGVNSSSDASSPSSTAATASLQPAAAASQPAASSVVAGISASDRAVIHSRGGAKAVTQSSQILQAPQATAAAVQPNMSGAPAASSSSGQQRSNRRCRWKPKKNEKTDPVKE
jgi:2',3'-cyclic-nucleotide 2'-phosphodiesterase (5'-nucleotidase family)